MAGGSSTARKLSSFMTCWAFAKSALSQGNPGKIMCAASAALKFLRNAGEVEGKYLQDIGLLSGETQRGQQHANKAEMS